MTVKIERYDPSRTYTLQKKFDCEHDSINKFVHGSLKGQVKAGTAVAWALVDTSSQDRFVGFYTLMMAQVSQNLVAGIFNKSIPAMVPCARLVMLGVDVNYKGNDFGKRLMKHAVIETKRAAELVGCRGMYLDAAPKAVTFYQALGFSILQNPQSPEDPTPMFLAVESF